MSTVKAFKSQFTEFAQANQSTELERAFALALKTFKTKVSKKEWESGWALANSNEVLIRCQALRSLTAACETVTKRDPVHGAFDQIQEEIAWQTVGSLDAVEAGQVLAKHGFKLSQEATLRIALQYAAPRLLETLDETAWNNWSWRNWEDFGNGMVFADPARHRRWLTAVWPHVAVALVAPTEDASPGLRSKGWLTRALVGAATFIGTLDLIMEDDSRQGDLVQQWAVNWTEWTKKLVLPPTPEDVWESAHSALVEMPEALSKMRKAVEREHLRKTLAPTLAILSNPKGAL